MDIVALIGRIIFVFLFLASSFGHLTKTAAMAGYAESKGVPLAKPATLASGVLMLVGALMVLLGIYLDLGALLLAIFLVPTAIMMHAFWKETDPQAKQMEMIQFNKDMGLAGASLLIMAIYAEGGDNVGLTITDPLF